MAPEPPQTLPLTPLLVPPLVPVPNSFTLDTFQAPNRALKPTLVLKLVQYASGPDRPRP